MNLNTLQEKIEYLVIFYIYDLYLILFKFSFKIIKITDIKLNGLQFFTKKKNKHNRFFSFKVIYLILLNKLVTKLSKIIKIGHFLEDRKMTF